MSASRQKIDTKFACNSWLPENTPELVMMPLPGWKIQHPNKVEHRILKNEDTSNR